MLPPVSGPTVQFDPAAGVIPFPNNLLLDPATGKVALPATACETPTAAALRTQVLNTLDGFGTYEAAMQVTLTAPIDPATLAGNIVMYRRALDGVPEDPATASQIPIAAVPSTTLRFSAEDCASPAVVDALTIVPLIPLEQRSTYTIALLAGIQSASGEPMLPSPTWALVRQEIDPVVLAPGCNPITFEGCVVLAESTPFEPAGDANHNGIPDLFELVGLDRLWKALAPGLAFLDQVGAITDRHQVLVAWEVTTQTVTDPLAPEVATSPAAALPDAPLVGTSSQTAGSCTPGQGCTAFLTALGVPCGALPCAAVGDVLGGGLDVSATTYQIHRPNPLPGGADVPGPWSDPVAPAPQPPFGGPLEVLIVVPNDPMPAGGWPTIVFGHDLTRSKQDLLALAPQLAAAGFASVAIDFVAHGSRAVRISDDPALGCAGGGVSPTAAPQCFAPIVSSDLAATRDNLRQSALDLELLVNALAACDPTACAGLRFGHLLYAGQSLGSLIGSLAVAADPRLDTALLYVPGAGLVDILERTDTLAIRCPLVNSLIDAGILIGERWDPAMPTEGLCTTDAWRSQPGYQQFAAIARWVLDPAEPANYTRLLAPDRLLLQEVVGDEVIPNLASDALGMLLGLAPQSADPFAPTTTTASAAILEAPQTSKWLRYETLPATDPATGGFGNLFTHGSLLAPAAAPGRCSSAPATTCTSDDGCGAGVCVFPGVLGTARMQLDAITFLSANQ